MELIHRNPWLNRLECHEGHQPDYFLERRAMLELALGRALTRCDSIEGYEILMRYLGDARSLLSNQALLELTRLSETEDRPQGRDPKRWLEWLETARPERETKPLNMHLDRVENSAEILRVVIPHGASARDRSGVNSKCIRTDFFFGFGIPAYDPTPLHHP